MPAASAPPVIKQDLPVPKVVVCPACKGPSLYGPTNAFRPFCSERCKNIDFGAWASESFRMPVETSPDDELEGSPKLQ